MITEIATAASALKTAIDIAGSLKDSKSSLQEAEMQLKLADLMGNLAETKMNMAEIQSLLLKKDETIRELEKRLKLKENLVYDGHVYWLSKENNEKDGPFCQKCYDTTDRLVRLQNHFIKQSRYLKCTACNISIKMK